MVPDTLADAVCEGDPLTLLLLLLRLEGDLENDPDEVKEGEAVEENEAREERETEGLKVEKTEGNPL